MAVLCNHKAFPAGRQQLLLAASSLMCHIKLNDDTYFTFALWPHGQRHGRGKLVDTFLERCQLVNMPDSARVIIWERPKLWCDACSVMELCQPKRRKTQKGMRYTEWERERGEETERAIIKTQKPFKSSPNFVADSVTPKRSQRNEILFGFFFVCVPPSTPAKEDTRPSRQWRSSRRAGREREERAEREKSR